MAQEPKEQAGSSSSGRKPRTARVIQTIIIAVTFVVAVIVGSWFLQESPDDRASEESPVLVSASSENTVVKQKRKKRMSLEERMKRSEAESQARREALAKKHGFRLTADGHMSPLDKDELAREKERRRKRQVRRFRWGSPAKERGMIWNVPRGEGDQALATALLRVCMAEADGDPQDCVGIWQVLKNIRNRRCARDYVRRITECEEGGGETMLSVIRRAQPHILAVPTYKLRNSRAGWIRNLETSCEMPKGWRRGENRWDAQYGSKRCPYTVQMVNHLIKNELPPERPGHRLRWLPGRPITWGGRCESGLASCDDRIACARGLARITRGPETKNAFWCRPGAPGCRRDAEPICAALGYGHLVVKQEARAEEPAGTEATKSTKVAEGEEGADGVEGTEGANEAQETEEPIATSERPLVNTEKSI